MQIAEKVSLRGFTTLQIGGPARYFAPVETLEDLRDGLQFARERGLPTFVLGGGSNLVVPDEGYSGLVLHMTLGSEIAVSRDSDGVRVVVDAGVDWDLLVRTLCEQGISGMECLAGIPGLTGGTPVQNVGAYGQEVGGLIESVAVLDRETLETRQMSRDECEFSYRCSVFNSSARGRYIVTQVTFLLATDARPLLDYADLAPLRDQAPTPLEVYRFVRSVRDRKGMLIDPDSATDESPNPDLRSAGSFFKNPVVAEALFTRIAAGRDRVPHWVVAGGVKLAAAWLIEQAGFPKGFTLGGAAISSRHTLALINRSGTATCAELLALRDTIIAGVEERFGVRLEQEPVFLA